MRDFDPIDRELLAHVAGGESVGNTDMTGPTNAWLSTADHGIDTLNRLSNVIQKFAVMAKPGFQGFSPDLLDPNGGVPATGAAPSGGAGGGAPQSRPRASVAIDQ